MVKDKVITWRGTEELKEYVDTLSKLHNWTISFTINKLLEEAKAAREKANASPGVPYA